MAADERHDFSEASMTQLVRLPANPSKVTATALLAASSALGPAQPEYLFLQLFRGCPVAAGRTRTNGRCNRVNLPRLMRAVGVCQMSCQCNRYDYPYDESQNDGFEELPNRANKNHVGLPSNVIRRDSISPEAPLAGSHEKSANTREEPAKKLLRPDNHYPKPETLADGEHKPRDRKS